MMKINIVGWRGLLHSYSIIAETYCIGLMKNPDNVIYFTEYPLYQNSWTRAKASVMDNLPTPNEPVDVSIKFVFPYDITPDSNAKCTIVFITSEFNYVSSLLDAGDLCENVWIATPSEYSKRGIIASGIPVDRILVVPHGYDRVPVKISKREIRKRLCIPENDFIFYHASSMTGNKNVKSLLLAFEFLYRENPNITLLLKGMQSVYGSNEKFIEVVQQLRVQMTGNAIQQLPSEKKYIYSGGDLSIEEMAEFYELADCYVSPFIAEGFNLPVLESLCHGTPVICTSNGPPDEFAKNGVYFIDSDLCHNGEKISVNGNDMDKRIYFPNIVHLLELMRKITTNKPRVDSEFFKNNYSTETIGRVFNKVINSIVPKAKEQYVIILDDDTNTQSILDNLAQYCGNAHVCVCVGAMKKYTSGKLIIECVIKDKTCNTPYGMCTMVFNTFKLSKCIWIRNDFIFLCDPRSYASTQTKTQNIVFNNGQIYMIVHNNANGIVTKNIPIDSLSVILKSPMQKDKPKYKWVPKRNNVHMLFRFDGNVYKKIYFALNDTNTNSMKHIIYVETVSDIVALLRSCHVAIIDSSTINTYSSICKSAPVTLAFNQQTLPTVEASHLEKEKIFVYPEIVEYFFQYIYPRKNVQFDLLVLPSDKTEEYYRRLDKNKLIKKVITKIE